MRRLNLVAGAPLVECGEWLPRLVEGSSKSAVAEGAVLGIGRAAATGEKKRDDRKNIDGLSGILFYPRCKGRAGAVHVGWVDTIHSLPLQRI